MKSIHPTLFVVTVLANLVVIRFSSYLLPDALYFSFSTFLFDNRDLVSPIALFLKLMITFAVGAGLALACVWYRRTGESMGATGEVPAAILADQVPITAAFGAFSAALLMAWPYILLWDLLIDPSMIRNRLVFLVAYLAYFVGYASFGLAGANTMIAWFRDDSEAPTAPWTWARLNENPYILPLMNALGGVATTFVSGLLGAVAG